VEQEANAPEQANANATERTDGEQANEQQQTNAANGPFARRVLTVVSSALGAVILAPLVLSGQDLYRWANSERGLDLNAAFAAFVPVSLDLAAVVCIGMVIIGAVRRRERPGLFGLLVWVFAGVSAYAQHSRGMAELKSGGAQDAFWFFPAIAVLGPLLLEVALHKLRRWARQDAGEQQHGAAGFGSRWLPGVAFRETIKAWAASRREGIPRWQDAVAYVREREALRQLGPVDAVRYAMDALRSPGPYDVRVWLQSRGVFAEQAALDEAFGEHPVAVPANERVGWQRTEETVDVVEREQPNEHVGERTPVETITERAPANVRPLVRPATPRTNGGTATDEQVAWVERTFVDVDWRTAPPSARELSKALGKTSTTPGNNLRKALIARAEAERSITATDAEEDAS